MAHHTETLHIDGMSCSHCVSSVQKALTETEGVTVEHVEIGTAQVTYDVAAVPRATIVEAIEDIGFDVIEKSAS